MRSLSDFLVEPILDRPAKAVAPLNLFVRTQNIQDSQSEVLSWRARQIQPPPTYDFCWRQFPAGITDTQQHLFPVP